MTADTAVRDQAIEWAARTGDPSFDRWEDFTSWLEADPAHARAYDEAVLAADDAAALLREFGSANDDSGAPFDADETVQGGRIRRWRWIGGALAAALVLMVTFGLLSPTERELYTMEAKPGSTRMIALAEGSRIDLAGGTRIELDRNDPRFARLERGQALFSIRHDEDDPFEVRVGNDTLVDAGTVFDVRYLDNSTSVAVSEGAVIFNPETSRVQVNPGRILRKSAARSGIVLAPIDPDQVGEWRSGRLTFRDASLAQVALDLTNATGASFEAASGSERASVSGSITVEPIREDPRVAGGLLGVRVVERSGVWILDAR